MITRNIDPDVARCRAALAGLASQSASQTVIDKAKWDLEAAKQMARVRAICENPIALTPGQFTSVVKALASVVKEGSDELAQ